MGRIIRNGIEYGSGNENATNINYDGTISGLEATTVQAAVDEVAESLGGIEFAIIDGKPQWKERGADSFSPFKSGGEPVFIKTLLPLETFTFENDYSYVVMFRMCYSDKWSTSLDFTTTIENHTSLSNWSNNGNYFDGSSWADLFVDVKVGNTITIGSTYNSNGMAYLIGIK